MPIPITQASDAPPLPQGPAFPVVPNVAFQQGDAQAIAALQAQAQTLTGQLSELAGHASELKTQVRLTHGNDRAVLSHELNQVNAQVAQVSGMLANVETQIALRQMPAAERVHTLMPPIPPTPVRYRGMDPDLVAGMWFSFIFAVLMPIAIGIGRRIWRRGEPVARPAQADVVSPRLDRLEQAVDAIAIEIERISENQRFMTKVLVERPAEARAVAQTPDQRDASSVGDAKPFLALGAGAMEPIRVAERQAVRQSVTPH